MTYIKTERNIWELLSTGQENGIAYYRCKHGSVEARLSIKEILKQANTIEELCDIYVMMGKRKRRVTGVERYYIIAHSNWPSNDVYGEIWDYDENKVPTLLPVAKIGDKGSLELL